MYKNINLQKPQQKRFDPTYVSYNPDNILAQSETIAPNYQTDPTTIKTNIIVINSIDRNWYNYANETPYNYLVKLGAAANDQYSVISNEYRNVVSISADRIILSNRFCCQSYDTSNSSSRLNDSPYITLAIEGINLSSYGTNNVLNDTIGIYTPLNPLPREFSNISYLEFKNTSNQQKEYVPIPEGIISRLNIRINNPLGTIASNVRDVLSIYSIFTNNANTNAFTPNDHLIIQTNEFFTANEFQRDDLLIIQNYKYHNPSYDESGLFNKFINRVSGHNILNIAKSNVLTLLYNQIYITIPATLSRSTGNLAVDVWYSSFIDKTFSNVAIADNMGKLINANTQSHLVVNIKTLVKDSMGVFLRDIV